MKKLKWTLLSAAILVGVSGAFGTRPQFDCSNDTQYYLLGGTYSLAGTEGVNYICTSGTGTCTYYTDDGLTYFPCQSGVYCTGNCDAPLPKMH